MKNLPLCTFPCRSHPYPKVHVPEAQARGVLTLANNLVSPEWEGGLYFLCVPYSPNTQHSGPCKNTGARKKNKNTLLENLMLFEFQFSPGTDILDKVPRVYHRVAEAFFYFHGVLYFQDRQNIKC